MQKYLQSIVKLYSSLLLELINRLYKGDIYYKLNEPQKVIYNGFNVIQHVFEYANNKTNNLEKSYFISQQACNYYCEYIEQIHESNLINTLNHNDAIIFVYKKTIFELYNKNQDTNLSNSIYLLQETTKDKSGDLSSKVVCLCHEVMYWDNNFTIEQRKFICEYYLPKILCNFKKIDLFIENIQLLKNKFVFSYDLYTQLLDEMLKYTKHNKNQMTDADEIILHFYYNHDKIEKSFHNNDMTNIVKLLILHGM